MALRLRIGPGAGSPLRMVGPGGDINNPLLADIIFDANHSPLRALDIGFMVVPSPGSAQPGTVFALNGRNIPPQTSWPLVLGLWMFQSNANPVNANWSIPNWRRAAAANGGGQGGGVAVTTNAVYGLNWWHNVAAPGGAITQNPIYVAYCVLRNKIGT